MRHRLAGACAALAGLSGGAVGAEPFALSAPAPDRALARDILSELIAINTVHDHGTTAAVNAIRARLRAAGFADSDLQVLAPPGHPDHPNLIVRLRGKGGGKPVMWIGHLDVVEAKPQDWTLPPFTLTEKEGYFYGRGTSDMKGDVAAVVESLIRLKREGFIPDRDIVAAFTADEESGDANGPDFLTRSHRDLVDAELVINPDGGGPNRRAGRLQFFGVQTSEKVYVTFQIEATNKGGHSSVPRPDNAIYQLAHALTRVEAMPQPVRLTATTRAWFGRMAQFETGQRKADMLEVASGSPGAAAAARISATPEGNAELHTTCVATLLSGGHAENALPQRATAAIQCRMMPGETQAEVQARIRAAINDPAVALTVISPADPSPESPPSPALMTRIGRIVHQVWPGPSPVADDGRMTRAEILDDAVSTFKARHPSASPAQLAAIRRQTAEGYDDSFTLHGMKPDAPTGRGDIPLVPVMERGATDGLFFRKAGIPTYGVSSLGYDLDDMRAHGRDERIRTSDFYTGVEFTYRLMKEMGRAGPG